LIAAIATPMGRGAIGILRLSGPGAAQAAGKVVIPIDRRHLASHPPRTLVYGTLRDAEGRALDRVLCTWSPAGGSYTGEETAEIHCHGSPAVLTLALEAVFAQGARQARAGEFTKRAFLNGRLDLTQAEAVADLIDAETPQAVRQAVEQLTGALSLRIGVIYDGLVDLLAHFHAVLDYPDEDITPFTKGVIAASLDIAEQDLRGLLDTYGRSRVIREGVPTAIVGRPNAGKSTLLNALVGYDRAIVTDIPGTTRDTVKEKCVLGGVLLRLTDTAGLRSTDDPVEKLGVERSQAAMEEARLILVVSDVSQPAGEEEMALWRRAMALAPTILVRSKTDLPAAPMPEAGFPLPPTVTVSVKERPEEAVRALGEEVAKLFPLGGEDQGEALTNARQAQAAREALEGILRAQRAFRAGMTPDALLTDVEGALEALGELTGRAVTEDVVNRIFQRFCVGK